MDDEWRVAAGVRRPRSAAIAGLAFCPSLTGALVLLQSAAPGSVAESGDWITDVERRDAVSKALALVPFAGIPFLWFSALRDQEFPLEAWVLAGALLGSLGARMSAVFARAVSTGSLRGRSLARWLVLVGYRTGVLLLLTPPLPRWAQLLFPLWVMAISVQVLWREHVHQKPVPPLTHGGP